MGKSLSNLSSIATEKTNTTGETTPILEVDPTDGTLIRLLNMVSTGNSKGLPIFAKLKDSNDNDLPTDTKLILRVQRPTDDEPVTVSVAEDNIAPWNNLTTAEQRNEENIDAVKVVLKGRAVNIRDADLLTVELNSSTQIDWSNSELYFAREGVEERSFEG
jgi:hypothetical protein